MRARAARVFLSGQKREDEMRDYQPKKRNPYYLEHTLYRRVLALVRDYPRMTAEWERKETL